MQGQSEEGIYFTFEMNAIENISLFGVEILYDTSYFDLMIESYSDLNNNGMYDYGEFFPSEHDEDGNGVWNCIGCSGEWGYVDWLQTENGDTLGYTIHRAEDVIDNQTAINLGNISFLGNSAQEAQFWIPVGIDEYSAVNGLSESEIHSQSPFAEHSS